MKETKDDFNKRKSEIEKYFSLLEILDEDNININYENKSGIHKIEIDTETIKILKANGYLLIYNLLEATCRNFLIAILKAIQEKNLPINSLSEKTQALWLKQKAKGLNDPYIKDKTIELRLHSLVKEIIDETKIEFKEIILRAKEDDKDLFQLSGNIDAENIRILADTYGFNSKVGGEKEKAGAILVDIRRMRNRLAHGRITFAECGKDLSVAQIIGYKNNAISYIEGILNNIEQYINDEGFKKTVSSPVEAIAE
ncbi:MAE_28990/MAE_18760 family HEPN-like nuclease [Hymenobacter cellulosilyticus]|uniref:MAE_28990/MAE_18760 family HEPN-like nuclease n=1 Tax=Hymenobacter cellulosilyticus TaxID=2932248 RepID=A0A8T9Q9A7_9BACT|nr:MAE_28990/MAE_18760 family HEPN-like nuclease [Hymenobacter cellulosilyticus]UOQ74094.1 MAE_28990/MAE_18760 family HEPN-like nuclease [Hymenobacter cellulosilyticus]